MGRRITRIPLTIEAVGTGHKTDGVLVAVLASDLDLLEAHADVDGIALACDQCDHQATSIRDVADHECESLLSGWYYTGDGDRAV